jgi:hypothetical protein
LGPLQAVDAATGFNRRVTEGKLAAKLVAKRSGLPNWRTIQTILELEVCVGRGGHTLNVYCMPIVVAAFLPSLT